MKKAPATIFSFFEKGERMSSESNIYVFSDNPEARERCKNFPVNVLGYKPAAENSPIIQKVLTWFGDSKSTDVVSVEKVLGGVYKKATKNQEQKFYLVFDVYGLEDIENSFDYWDALQKQPNIKIFRFSFSKESIKDGVHSLAAILNELCPECAPEQSAKESEKEQESDKQDSNRKTTSSDSNQVNALVKTFNNLIGAINQINAKAETLSQDMEAVKTVISKKSDADDLNLQLRRELNEKVQQASTEMSKAKRNEKQWVQCVSSFLDSLAAEADNPDLSEDIRSMAQRYSKALLRYLEPVQFEKIELAVGDEWNPNSGAQARYSETETVPQGEPLRILEIQEQGYKYQGVLVKNPIVIVPKPVQTADVKEETIEIVDNDVNNESAEI